MEKTAKGAAIEAREGEPQLASVFQDGETANSAAIEARKGEP
jgi:hypothetical protein